MLTKERLHLVELEDLGGFPPLLRDFLTDFLSKLFAVTKPYEVVHDLLRDALEQTKAKRMVDLCSGGGTPALLAHRAMELPIQVKLLLTDKFPNCDAIRRHGRIYRPDPLDVIADPVPNGFRTIFTAFHHFDHAGARAVLENAVRDRQPIAVFEMTERSLMCLMTIFSVPLLVWCLTPFIKPFRWDRLFLTYVIPVVAFCALWDGIVSTFRSYTEAELQILVKDLPQFTWSSGVRRSALWLRVTYLIGLPREAATSSSAFQLDHSEAV
jgi:hypothetical protein